VDTQVGRDKPNACTGYLAEITGECSESMMDVELIKATGSGVPLTVVYNAQYSLEEWALELSAMNDEELPLVNSVSYGDDEIQQDQDATGSQSGAEYMDALDTEFMKLGLRGASILVASGDQGVWGRSGVLNGDAFHADFPASSPYVTSVGGTDLKVANVIGEEQAWSDGGGGFSSRTDSTRPSWQNAAVSSYLSKLEGALGTPPAETYSRGKRAYPDVSALGGVQNPYCVVVDKSVGWLGIAGTSASSPVFAGIVARLNDKRISNGMPSLGFLNPFLYANPDAFNDVTYGENKGEGYVGFRPAEGWDAATGLGTPNYPKLLSAALSASASKH